MFPIRLFTAAALVVASASAQSQVNVICAMQAEWCNLAQALGAQAKQFQIPSNVGAPISPLSPKIADIKLINYDFAKYGTSAERKRLLERWDREVGSLAK